MSRHRARHLLGQGSGGGSRLGSPLGRPSSLGLLGDSDPKQSPLSSLPLWTPGRSAPSSQRSDGTLGLAWIAARRSRTPAKRALLRRCTPHISSLPHRQFYPSGPQRRLPLPTPLAGGAVLPGERSAASRRAASGRGRPRLLSEKKRALSEARRAPISGRPLPRTLPDLGVSGFSRAQESAPVRDPSPPPRLHLWVRSLALFVGFPLGSPGSTAHPVYPNSKMPPFLAGSPGSDSTGP